MIIWVTRDEVKGGPLSTALMAHGLPVVLEPVVERRVTGDVEAILADLDQHDWLVLTSPFAVAAVAKAPRAAVPNVAVVGESSQQLAIARGLRVGLVSPASDAASLATALREKARDCRICYPRSSEAATPEAWPGVELRAPVLYETSPRDFDRTVSQRVNAAAITSPSAMRAIGPTSLPLASIGATTSACIRALGMTPWVEAARPSFSALAEAIAAAEARPKA